MCQKQIVGSKRLPTGRFKNKSGLYSDGDDLVLF